MVVILLIIECYVHHNSWVYSNDRLMEWSTFGHNAADGRWPMADGRWPMADGRWPMADGRWRDADILCFGDSLVKVGVLPRIVEKKTGLTSYNFALGYGQAPSSYYMLKQFLDVGAKPKHVIIDYKWTTLMHNPDVNANYYPSILNLGNLLELAARFRSLDFASNLLMSRAFPSFRSRDDLRVLIYSHLQGDKINRWNEYVAWNMTWQANKGTCLAPVNALFDGKVDVSNPFLFPPKWFCRPINRYYVKRLLRLAQSRNISVFWVLPPIHPAATAQLEKSGVDLDYISFVLEMQSTFPNVTVIDGRHSGYRASLFVDPTHLNRHGAESYSADLGDTVRNILHEGVQMESRWVHLPAFEPRETGVLIRDICESREELRREAESLRR